MKTVIALFLFVAIMINALGQSLILLHYLINKNYYTTVLCENKSDPMLNCKGQCQLMKDAKEQDKKEQSPASPVIEKQETLLFFKTYNLNLFRLCENKIKHTVYYLVSRLPVFSFSVFHPPRFEF